MESLSHDECAVPGRAQCVQGARPTCYDLGRDAPGKLQRTGTMGVQLAATSDVLRPATLPPQLPATGCDCAPDRVKLCTIMV